MKSESSDDKDSQPHSTDAIVNKVNPTPTMHSTNKILEERAKEKLRVGTMIEKYKLLEKIFTFMQFFFSIPSTTYLSKFSQTIFCKKLKRDVTFQTKKIALQTKYRLLFLFFLATANFLH